MQPGDTLELDITGIAHGGVFVARHEGRVVFVPDTLPGERIAARLTDTRKSSFWRAEALEVLSPAPERRAHVWQAAGIDTPPERRPGGAEFGHIELGHQRALKARVLSEALERTGRLELPVSVVAAGEDGEEHPEGLAWRTRLGLHVDADGVMGVYAARSHRVIAVDEHPLAVPAISRAIARRGPGREGRIDFVAPADGRVRVIPRGAGEKREPEASREWVRERVGGREFRVQAGGFWQVHRLAAATLSRAVARALAADGGIDPAGLHLDLYGGVGLFGAALAEAAGPGARVVSVEADERASDAAGENLAEWTGARAETARVDRWLQALEASAAPRERARIARGAVVLDPPRAGAGAGVVEALARLDPERIVYVACDPVALARDLRTFADAGFETARVDGIDLFPNSHHVEAVTVLRRQR